MEHGDGDKLHIEINLVSSYSVFFPSQALSTLF
jgi:hypothetical protein